MKKKVKIRYKFLIASFILVFLAGGLSYYIADLKLKKYVLESHIESSSKYINSLASNHFNFSESINLKSAGDPAKFGEKLIQNNGYEELIVTDANGTILYAENKKLINTTIHTDHNWKNAISGLSFTTNIDYQNGKITNYIPLISTNNNIRGVVYFTSNAPETLGTINNFKADVAIIVISISLIFIIFAYLIVYELENQMNQQERSITDSSKALAEEQRLYEAITSSLAESLIVVNHDNQIILFNPEAEKLTGHNSSDVEYRSYKKIINLYNENGKKLKIDPVAEALKSGQTIKTSSKNNYFIKKEKALIPIVISAAPIKSDKSLVKGVAVTIEDISAEKELQKVKDEFVYLVAHELGNPIFALDGYLTILEGSLGKIDKNTTEILESAKGINNQLSTLVNDLLEVSKNETGRLAFELEEIDLIKIFETVLKNESFKAREKNIKINLKKIKLPKVHGNSAKIKEVVTNLVNNAIKYTPEKGRVEIYFDNKDNKIVSNIKDSGIGLSEKNKKHLFEKFFRAKEKETENIPGTGLGLFISRQIIEKCGGKIWAQSIEGKGSTFSFSLKISK